MPSRQTALFYFHFFLFAHRVNQVTATDRLIVNGRRTKVQVLTHWGRVTHICVAKLTIIGSDNGFSPGRRQAIIWTNAGILLIRPLETNFSEIFIGIQTFSFKKKLIWKCRLPNGAICLGLNVLTHWNAFNQWFMSSLLKSCEKYFIPNSQLFLF